MLLKESTCFAEQQQKAREVEEEEFKRMAKLITVFGATGSQGGPVVRALLAVTGYKVRGVTRNPDSELAKALKAAGAEVVKGNLDDAASVQNAVSGAYGVFLMTNYAELIFRLQDADAARDKEIAQGKTVADACKTAGVKHLVFSGMELVKDITGKSCPHFDSKGTIEKYLDEIGVPNTSVRYPFYYENFINPAFKPQEKDGVYELTYPMKGPMDGISVEDGGPVVAAVFGNPQEYIGKKVGISGERKTMPEYLAIMSEVSGKTFKYNLIDVDEYAKLPNPVAPIFAPMFDFFDRGNPVRDIALTKKLNPNLLTFQEWATKNKAKI